METNLVGRDQDLEQLTSTLSRTLEHQESHVVLVSGEAGIGKTRLLSEFLSDTGARLGPDRVLFGYGQAVMTSLETDAFQSVRECLRAIVAVAQASDSPQFRKRVADAFKEHAPDWLESIPLVGLLLAAGVKTGRTFGGSAGSSTAVPESPMDQMINLLSALLQTRPLLLVFDDMHWADAATVDLLTNVVLKVPGPLMVVLAYREDDAQHGMAGRHPLMQAIFKLQRYRTNYREVRLQRLTSAETELLVRRVAATRDLSGREVDLIAARSGGVPLFAESLCLVNPGTLNPDAGIDDTPQAIRAVLQERLGFLDTEEERLIEACALIGSEFEVDYVAELLRLDTDDVFDQLDRLMRDHALLKPATPRGQLERYAIHHPLLVDVLRGRASANGPRWRRLHRRLLAILTDDLDRDPELIVRCVGYAVQAGDDVLASELALTAAEKQVSLGAVSKARSLAQIAVDAGNQDADALFRAYGLAVSCLAAEANHRGAASMCRAALEDSRLGHLRKDETGSIRLDWARSLRMTNRWDGSISLLDEIEELPPPADSSAISRLDASKTEAKMLRAEIALCGPTQNVTLCRTLCKEVLESNPDSSTQVRACGHLGLAALAAYDPQLAEQHLSDAIELAQTLENAYMTYEAIHWMSKKKIACLELGEAQVLLDQLTDNSQQSGVASDTPFHLRDSSRVSGLMGDEQAAAARFARLVDLAPETSLDRVLTTLACQHNELCEAVSRSAAWDFACELSTSIDSQMIDRGRRERLRDAAVALRAWEGERPVEFAVSRLAVNRDEALAADAIFRFDVASLSRLREGLDPSR